MSFKVGDDVSFAGGIGKVTQTGVPCGPGLIYRIATRDGREVLVGERELTLQSELHTIWLSPECADLPSGERTWADNDVWGACPTCGAKPVRYVRAGRA